jgi:hypothetical protein
VSLAPLATAVLQLGIAQCLNIATGAPQLSQQPPARGGWASDGPSRRLQAMLARRWLRRLEIGWARRQPLQISTGTHLGTPPRGAAPAS